MGKKQGDYLEGMVRNFSQKFDVYPKILTFVPEGLKSILAFVLTLAMADYESADNLPWKDSCAYITEVTIDEGVTRIGKKAFKNCQNFPSVTIPASVESVGENAFGSCAKLATVYKQNALFLEGAGIPSTAQIWGYSMVKAPEHVIVSGTTKTPKTLAEDILCVSKRWIYRKRTYRQPFKKGVG